MLGQLQERFELLLFGTDSPRKPKKSTVETTSSGSLTGNVKSAGSSTTTLASLSHRDEKVLAESSMQDILCNEQSVKPGHRKDYAWEPSKFHIRPFIGICALLIAIGCVFWSLMVLLISHDQPVDEWTIQPTVYLAAISAVANSAFALARAQAVPVAWWYRASKGASIRALESQWHVTNTFGGAIVYGKISLMTAACIVTSLAILDGPLLQRASTVRQATLSSNVTLPLQLLPELPNGFSGYLNGLDNETYATPAGAYTFQEWLLDSPIPFHVPECKSSCRTTVQAPGIVKENCTSKTWPITAAIITNTSASWGNLTSTGPEPNLTNATRTSNPIFYVDLIDGLAPDHSLSVQREGAYLTVGFANLTNATAYKDFYVPVGRYVETACWLLPAIVNYDVIIEANAVRFDGNANQGRLVSLANNSLPNEDRWALPEFKSKSTTIGGITQMLWPLVNANVRLSAVRGYFNDWTTFNPISLRHLDTHDFVWGQMAFRDPTDDVIFKYNQLMFRGGVYATGYFPYFYQRGHIDEGLSVNQTVVATQSFTQNVFKSDLKWYAGATAIQLLTVLLLLPLFWGWWTLGSINFTLSPFNIALAFASPLLKGVNSAAGARGVVRELGDMQVKFGLVHDVATPLEGKREDAGAEAASGRLGIAERGSVVRPRKGMRFAT